METMYRASIVNVGDSKYYASTKDASFVLDTEGRGANPVDALLASLCACIGHYVRDYLREQRIAYRGFTIESEAGISADKSKLSEIRLWIALEDALLDEPQRSALLTYVERCKVHGTLKEGCPVKLSLGQPAKAQS